VLYRAVNRLHYCCGLLTFHMQSLWPRQVSSHQTVCGARRNDTGERAANPLLRWRRGVGSFGGAGDGSALRQERSRYARANLRRLNISLGLSLANTYNLQIWSPTARENTYHLQSSKIGALSWLRLGTSSMLLPLLTCLKPYAFRPYSLAY